MMGKKQYIACTAFPVHISSIQKDHQSWRMERRSVYSFERLDTGVEGS